MIRPGRFVWGSVTPPSRCGSTFHPVIAATIEPNTLGAFIE